MENFIEYMRSSWVYRVYAKDPSNLIIYLIIITSNTRGKPLAAENHNTWQVARRGKERIKALLDAMQGAR